MDWKKAGMTLFAVVGAILLLGLAMTGNIIGIVIVLVLLLVGALLFQNTLGKDLVDEVRKELKTASGFTKHELKNIYLLSNKNIDLKGKPWAKINHYNEFVGYHLFFVKKGFFGKELIIACPDEMIIKPKSVDYITVKSKDGKNEITKQTLIDGAITGNVIIRTTGFIPCGEFYIPNNCSEKVSEKLTKSFISGVGYKSAIESQRNVGRLLNEAVNSNPEFIKERTLTHQEPLDLHK